LTGLGVEVSNYPGSTAEMKGGSLCYQRRKLEVVDLPGIYALDGSSEEACRLEHEISDETISRLSEYIENPPRPCVRYGWRHAFRPQECIQPATVLDFSEGSRLKVLLVGSPGANRRLIDLGVIPGAVLEIRRRLRNGSVVVKVKGCDVALSPEIARCIHVEPFT
ncbi:MAG: hypothetical protein GKC04_07495, partial [Methanomicrobiales archaeon]|nr:hypothetical protein [Methanomicrobiales archaeon]